MFIILLLGLLLPSFSFDALSPFIDTLHTWCVNKVDQQTLSHVNIHKALVCGSKLPVGEVRTIFTQAGLIHLMVVSGAHLIFLEKGFGQLPSWPYKKLFTFSCLIFYSLMAELHPPIFRALVSFFLTAINKKFQLNWSGYWRTMFSGIICVILNPEWISSFSLQLSWVGALCFSYKHSRMMAQLLSYICLLPLISQWTTLHPLSIGLNWLFVPILSTTLFPLSLLSFIFPPLYSLTNTLCSGILYILQALQPLLANIPFYSFAIPPALRWTYILFLFLLFYVLEKFLHRMKL